MGNQRPSLDEAKRQLRSLANNPSVKWLQPRDLPKEDAPAGSWFCRWTCTQRRKSCLNDPGMDPKQCEIDFEQCLANCKR